MCSPTLQLKPEYAQAILRNPALLGIIAQSQQRSIATVTRWARGNSSQLTLLAVLSTVRQFLQLPPHTVLTQYAAPTDAPAPVGKPEHMGETGCSSPLLGRGAGGEDAPDTPVQYNEELPFDFLDVDTDFFTQPYHSYE